jgi:ABC-type phosphate/phosphonate transport system substrate-binding protein
MKGMDSDFLSARATARSPRINRRNFIRSVTGFVSCLAEFAGAQLRAGVAPVHVAFSGGLFMDVNTTDALAATRVWARAIAQKKGFEIEDPYILDDINVSIEAFKAQRIDIAALLTKEYLEIREKVPLVPCFMPKRNGRTQQDFLVLVHVQSGFNRVEDLAGKEILLLAGMEGNLGRAWLENILMEKGYASCEKYFKRVTQLQRASRAVLPVYFRQTDACLVTSYSFETLVELNPQLKTQLKAVAVSPAFAPAVMCVRANYESPYKQPVLDALRNLHLDPKGQQILMLFKIDEIVPMDPVSLESARQLLIQNARLKEQIRRKSAGEL